MLQAADLTIKLNPADDVVIARVETARRHRTDQGRGPGVRSTCPPGTRSPSATSRKARRCAATTRSSALRPSRSGPASTCTCTTWRWAHFERDYAFCAGLQADRVRGQSGDLQGIVRAGRPRGHAQLHGVRQQRQLLGPRVPPRSPSTSTASAWPTIRMSTASSPITPQDRLRHGFHRRTGGSAAPRPGGLCDPRRTCIRR